MVERGIIISLSDNETAGIGAIGAHMEILLIHHFYLTPHSPITTAMTSDESHYSKMGIILQFSKQSYVIYSMILLVLSIPVFYLPVQTPLFRQVPIFAAKQNTTPLHSQGTTFAAKLVRGNLA